MAINYERASQLLSEQLQAMKCDESARLCRVVDKLQDASERTIPWDWRYNATYWASDVTHLCEEIGYSVAWMRAFACYYRSESDWMDKRYAEGLVSYYADNAATRISSCRDKIAILAWSYYCPFNPDERTEVLTFGQVYDRLIIPLKFGLQLKSHEEFLAEMNNLRTPWFDKAAAYRHKKIHRMEPRVLMHKPEDNEQTPYMVPVTSKDVRNWDEQLKEKYPDDGLRKDVRNSCHIDGVLFDRRGPNELLWHFDDFNQFADSCWRSLCKAAAGSCEILLRREPICSEDSNDKSG